MTKFEDIEGKLDIIREENRVIGEEVHSLALRQHIMNEKLPKITKFSSPPLNTRNPYTRRLFWI
jgi:hypothetical protein